MGLRGVAFLFVSLAATGFAHQRDQTKNGFMPQAGDGIQASRKSETVAEQDVYNIGPITLTDADRAIDNLRRKTRELTEARNRFLKKLDEAIGRFDSNWRTPDGRKVLAADADLTSGPADIMWAGVRKLFAARMLGARDVANPPAALAEMDRFQSIIGDARDLADASQRVVRGLLLVSAKDLDPRRQGEWKSRHEQLLKARTVLEEAAKQAYASLPIDLPDGDTAEERNEKAWDLIVMGNKVPRGPGGHTPPTQDPGNDRREPTLRRTRLTLPITLEQGKRITLINESGYRMALTDSGIEDQSGRHLFYQEEWIQRGAAVLRFRWRVAVDTASGEHIMIRRYEARERHGSLDTLYELQNRDYLWYLEPPGDGAEPSRPEVEGALTELTHAREAIRSAIADYRSTIREALEMNDADDPGTIPDYGLPSGLRNKLFAIRGHLAQVPAVVAAEAKVGNAIEDAMANIARLEPLAAWANRNSSDGTLSAAEWEKFQNRADDEIAITQSASAEAHASLPPDFSVADGRFPPLQKDVIVHLVRRSAWGNSGTAIRCLQEVWQLAASMRGSRRVQRTVTVIEVDRETGRQKNVSSSTQYYPAGPNDSVERIYDQYAAQDVPVSGLPLYNR